MIVPFVYLFYVLIFDVSVIYLHIYYNAYIFFLILCSDSVYVAGDDSDDNDDVTSMLVKKMMLNV